MLESGRFAPGWGEMAETLGCTVETLPAGANGAVDPAAVEAHLRADTAHRIKAILVVQIDTASSVWNDIAAIRKAIDAAAHPALYMVDGIASIGCVPFEMDAWGVDLALTGSQKGLMMPPGLSFLMAGPRAIAAYEAADLKTRYWDWGFRNGDIHYMKYAGTPPVQHLYAARRAFDMLLTEEGLEMAWHRHALLARATRAAVARWTEGGAIRFAVADPAHRCDTVTLLHTTANFDAQELRAFTAETCGVTLGVGLGEGGERSFRIAHMGHVNAPMLLGTLSSVQMGLQALGWSHGAGGVEAAITTLAEATGKSFAAAAE